MVAGRCQTRKTSSITSFSSASKCLSCQRIKECSSRLQGIHHVYITGSVPTIMHPSIQEHHSPQPLNPLHPQLEHQANLHPTPKISNLIKTTPLKEPQDPRNHVRPHPLPSNHPTTNTPPPAQVHLDNPTPHHPQRPHHHKDHRHGRLRQGLLLHLGPLRPVSAAAAPGTAAAHFIVSPLVVVVVVVGKSRAAFGWVEFAVFVFEEEGAGGVEALGVLRGVWREGRVVEARGGVEMGLLDGF